jgi:hypothetical protein
VRILNENSVRRSKKKPDFWKPAQTEKQNKWEGNFKIKGNFSPFQIGTSTKDKTYMAETTAPQTVTPPPDKKPRQPRGALNAGQTAELNKAEQLGLKAQNEELASKLAARKITAGFTTTLLADIKDCRKTSTEAVGKTTSLRVITSAEHKLQEQLMVALQEIQTAARQKFRRKQPEVLDDYFIGETLDANRPGLVQFSEGILSKAAKDDLPGITPEKIAAAIELRTQYVKIETDQADGQKDAGEARGTRDEQVQSITDRRIEIQLAAEAEWPSSNKANASIRTEFFLPANRPFAV